MTRFLKKVTFFIIAIILVDYSFGFIADKTINKINHGNIGKANYIHNNLESEIIVLGSSKAARHYNAKMISDSLNLSCYNCGEPGHGIIYNYPRYSMIKERCTPQIIIYDLIWDYDFSKEVDNNQFLGSLKPFYQRNGISDIFSRVDYKNKYKMQSNLYRYNSKYLQYLSNFLGIRDGESNILGFMPLYGSLDKMKVSKKTLTPKLNIDSLKLEMMQDFIKDSSNSLVIFVCSPTYHGIAKEYCEFFKTFANTYNKKFLDFSNDEKFLNNDSLFKDGTHLNSVGADKFTKELIHFLKQEFLHETIGAK